MTTPILSSPPGQHDTMPADDRRSSPRFHLKLAITLRGDNNFYTGVSSDISEGGIFIATQYILPIGTPVVLQFHLSRYDVDLTIRGTVRWIRDVAAVARGRDAGVGGAYIDEVKAGMGVQFDGVGPHEAALIKDFMRCRNPELFD